MTALLRSLLFLALLVTSLHAAEPSKPTSHTTRQIEGWTVRVDDRLLHEESVQGETARKLLAAELLEISLVVPEPALSHLRGVKIQVDFSHGELHSMQYHPNAGWLREHGYDEALEKCVHIPQAGYFISAFEVHRQPWAVLHELAHAYHDQVLGFNDPRIKAAWEKFRDSGNYQSVLTVGGRQQAHYALTNEREFFSEMTECYFGTNDFYPFVSGELQLAEPEIFALLQEIWGALPVPTVRWKTGQ